MADPPTAGGTVLTYVIMVAVFIAAVIGAAFAVALEAWGASGCLPSGRQTASGGSVTATILVLGSILLAYCLGCAAYLWGIGATAVHSRVWLGISVAVIGLILWVLVTTKHQDCGYSFEVI